MKHSFGVLIFASLLFSSCNDRTGASISSESITDLSRMDRVEIKERKQISVDSVIEKIDYVKLGDTGDVLIGKVTHLLITPDHFVIGDTRQAKAVFVFDRAGNVQAVISRLGRGPQEYQDLNTIFLSPDRQAIGIVDNSTKKLLYFDMAGNFIKKQDLPFSCNGIEYLDDKTLMLGGQIVGPRILSRQKRPVVFYGHDSAYPKQCDCQSFQCRDIQSCTVSQQKI